jgi:Family of unknown function (DUF6178)
MDDKKHLQLTIEKARLLARKRQEIAKLPPEKVLDRILEDPQPAALVHSFPEEDLYFLIHAIGPEDSLPLLKLASNKQWEYMMDLDSWARDRIDLTALTRWLNLLLQADSRRFIAWCLKEKLDIVEFYFSKNIDIRIREHDQDPSEFGDDYFTQDDVIYVRILDLPPEADATAITDEHRRAFLGQLIDRLAAHDHTAYYNVLFESTAVIGAEIEEDAYRRRNIRLAEKGFLPFDEAVGVYQALTPQDLQKRRPKYLPPKREEWSGLPVPLTPIELLRADTPFTRALQHIDADAVLQQLQAEFAGLCNQLIVADQRIIRDKDALRDVVTKAGGYVSSALQCLSPDPQKVDARQAAIMIERYGLIDLFRVGFGRALAIKWRAERWLHASWFVSAGLRLTFWGEEWLGILGGLLIKKPLFFDNYQTGSLYREFLSLEDIQATEAAFEQIKALDELLGLLAIQIRPISSYGFLTYKSLLLTSWARNSLDLSTETLKPLSLNEFKAFFERLFGTAAEGHLELSRRISQGHKESFLDWLAGQSGLKDYEIAAQIGSTLENLFKEVESEYGRVSVEALDPRYIHLFLIERPRG